MIGSVKQYASSVQTRLGETYTAYTSKDKIDQLLIEATSNDQWSVSNQKLLDLADATHGPDGIKIVDHLIIKLKAPAFEYRRVLKSLNLIEFLLKNGNLNVLGKVQMTAQRPLTELQTFEYREGAVDHGKQIRDKAYLVMDLMHNRHKLEAERDQATEYRKKFYTSGSGGFQGAGGGSFSNAGDGHGYTVPSTYTPAQSSYQGPASTASQVASDGVSRVYSPYNPADDPVLKVPTKGAMKWGPTPSSSNVVSSSAQPGSTYNITNNNNINYNYGSNITAISSDGGGSVPTFHDLDKRKREAAEAGGPSYASSTLGYIGSSIGQVSSGVGNSTGGLGSVTKSLQTSKAVAQMSESVKRHTGLDLHRALGGKTAVELAEDRLQREQAESRGGYGGSYSGYQGVSIPLTPAPGGGSQAAATGSGYSAPSETLKVATTSKYTHSWGPSAVEQEEPKLVQSQKLFRGLEPQKKRLDDDSDEDDDKPKKIAAKKVEEAPKKEEPKPKKEEVDLLDMNVSEPPKDLLSDMTAGGAQQNNLLDMGQASQTGTSTNILDFGQPSQDLLGPTQSQAPASAFGFLQQSSQPAPQQPPQSFQVPSYGFGQTASAPANTAGQSASFSFMNQQPPSQPAPSTSSPFDFMQQAAQQQPQPAPAQTSTFAPSPFGQFVQNPPVQQQQQQQPNLFAGLTQQAQQQSQFAFMSQPTQPSQSQPQQMAPSDPFGNFSKPAQPVQQPSSQPSGFAFMGQAPTSSGSQGQSAPMADLFGSLNIKDKQTSNDSQQQQVPAQTQQEQDTKPKDAWAMGAKLIKF